MKKYNITAQEDLVIYLIVCLFLIKALVLAFGVTPLWDIPDETGHFSYVRDMATSYKVPLLGDSLIGSDILSNLYHKETTGTQANWIAQHPPVYYFFSAIIYKIGTYFTSAPELLFRIPRIASALFASMTLLVLYRIFQSFRLSKFHSMFLVAFIAFLPMYSNMSSGTNNDMGVTFFTTLSIGYWVAFLQTSHVKDGYWSMFWISVAIATKMTALVIMVPMLLIILFEIRPFSTVWMKHAVGLSTISVLLPLPWFIRNYLEFGTPLATAHTLPTNKFLLEDNPLNVSIIDFLSKVPFYEHFFINFFGLFGWIGTGKGMTTHWVQISGIPLEAYTYITFIIVSISLVLFLKYIQKSFFGYKCHTDLFSQKIYVVSSLFIAFVLGYILIDNLYTVHTISGHFRKFIFIELLVLSFLSTMLLFFPHRIEYKIRIYAIVVFSFFAVVITWKLYGIYLLDGRMRATHGRYFYPLIAMLMIGVFMPVLKYLKPKRSAMLFVVIILIVLESMTIFRQAIPWYSI